MSRTEWLTCRALALDDTDGFVAASERNYRRARLDEEVDHPAAAARATPTAGGSASRRPATPGSWPGDGSSSPAAAGRC